MAGMRMARTHSTKAAGAYAQHGGPGARLRPGQRRRAATHTRTRSRASHADVPACGKSARVLAARNGMCRGAVASRSPQCGGAQPLRLVACARSIRAVRSRSAAAAARPRCRTNAMIGDGQGEATQNASAAPGCRHGAAGGDGTARWADRYVNRYIDRHKRG